MLFFSLAVMCLNAMPPSFVLPENSEDRYQLEVEHPDFVEAFHTSTNIETSKKTKSTLHKNLKISKFPNEEQDDFSYYYVNEQKMPLVISPKEKKISQEAFQNWLIAHKSELLELISEEAAILLRDFPVDSSEEFAQIVQTILGEPISYVGGDGSRKSVSKGVYTSTEGPPKFKIPLHNELSCTNNPVRFICFYCDIAPEQGTGQTLLGKTLEVHQEIFNRKHIWDFFDGKNILYITRHPPAGNLFSRVNVTHKTWPEVFETTDRAKVEEICKEKGFKYQWLGDWIEVVRVVPAIKDADSNFPFPYWFNQIQLYHHNKRLLGGAVNQLLYHILYKDPLKRNYDVQLSGGIKIPKKIMYDIWDILDNKTVYFDWQEGDVLIIDNIKGMHGRAPCKGSRRILVSMVQ